MDVDALPAEGAFWPTLDVVEAIPAETVFTTANSERSVAISVVGQSTNGTFLSSSHMLIPLLLSPLAVDSVHSM
jgi:hypothetical protein